MIRGSSGIARTKLPWIFALFGCGGQETTVDGRGNAKVRVNVGWWRRLIDVPSGDWSCLVDYFSSFCVLVCFERQIVTMGSSEAAVVTLSEDEERGGGGDTVCGGVLFEATAAANWSRHRQVQQSQWMKWYFCEITDEREMRKVCQRQWPVNDIWMVSRWPYWVPQIRWLSLMKIQTAFLTIRETVVNAGSKTAHEPSAHFPRSQSWARLAYFRRCFGYKHTGSTCGCAEGGRRPPAFGPKACLRAKGWQFPTMYTLLLSSAKFYSDICVLITALIPHS